MKDVVEGLIVTQNVQTFLFGSKSEFDDMALNIVTRLKEAYPAVKRVYVRAVYPLLRKEYEEYLLELYDATYMPMRVERAGTASYVQRNREMIEKSDIVVVYYEEKYALKKGKSGTRIAYSYAKNQKKLIINVCEE
ncbi:MAG: hypothetical protein IJX88_05885 [Clostridia bacterium]|nr:hypothetical protein [Clostridia bacterium]